MTSVTFPRRRSSLDDLEHEYDLDLGYDYETNTRLSYTETSRMAGICKSLRTSLSSMDSVRLKLSNEDNDYHGEIYDDDRVWLPKRFVYQACLLTLVFITAFLVKFGVSAARKQPSSTAKTLFSPSPEIAQKCSLGAIGTAQGYESCKNICETAECCTSKSQSCLEENEESCGQYNIYCKNIYTANYQSFNSTVVPPAPWNIKTACSTTNILLEESRQECEESCLPGKCCNLPPEDNCRKTNPTCTGYQICSNLQNIDGYSITSARVDEACSFKTLSIQGNSQCEKMCNPAACCFNVECEAPSTLNCQMYKSCSILYDAQQEPGTNFVSNADKEYLVTTVCTEELVSTYDGYSACSDLCKEHICCFVKDSVANCFESRSQWCNKYTPCKILLDDDAVGGIENQVDLSTFDKSKVETICSEQNIQNGEGTKACSELCASSMCCFAGAAEENCLEEQEIECHEYSACVNILLPPPGEEPVEDVCSGENISSDAGREKCRQTCFQRECCFLDQPFNCYSYAQTWCDEYTACRILHSGYQHNKNTFGSRNVHSVNELCTKEKVSSPEGYHECEQACLDRSCCFLPDRGNCYSTDEEWCDEYSICNDLYDLSDVAELKTFHQKTRDELISDLDKAC